MSEAIDQAFIATILDGGLAIDISHENGLYSAWDGASYAHEEGVYVPSANREYCEIKNFPADRVPFSLKHSDNEVGFFQIILRYPVDVGAHTIKAKAEEALNLFTPGVPISYAGQNVNIESKRRDGGRVEDGFYQIVARVSYSAFVQR